MSRCLHETLQLDYIFWLKYVICIHLHTLRKQCYKKWLRNKGACSDNDFDGMQRSRKDMISFISPEINHLANYYEQ